jgi:hypothetical protein
MSPEGRAMPAYKLISWPKSRACLARIFAGTPEEDLRKVTSENAARLFGFTLN